MDPKLNLEPETSARTAFIAYAHEHLKESIESLSRLMMLGSPAYCGYYLRKQRSLMQRDDEFARYYRQRYSKVEMAMRAVGV